MVSTRWMRMLPLLAMLIVGLSALAAGCGGSSDGQKGGGKGGAGANEGLGGAGGVEGVGGGGGTGGEEEPPRPCSDESDCREGDRCDEEAGLCVPKCVYDMDCGRDTGTRCDEETGICVEGEGCQQDFNCGYADDYCAAGKGECVCVPDSAVVAKDENLRGVCWRKSAICEPCDGDQICGNGSSCNFFQVGPGNTEAVCLPNGNCSQHPGTQAADGETFGQELAGKCIPYTNDCLNFAPCERDDECPLSRPVCDLSRQICIPGCSFDFHTGNSIGCASDKTCHYTRAGMEKSLLDRCETADAFGAGKCELPCSSDSECARKDCEPGETDCPTEDWICRDDRGKRRCGPPGCVDDSECEILGQQYRGYCDVDSGQCVTDRCRSGEDHRRGCGGLPFPDCDGLHKCVEDDPRTETGTCEPKDCVDKGGADLACMVGEFCRGEYYRDPDDYSLIDKQRPGQPSEAEAPFPGCYPLNETAYCDACENNSDCGQGRFVPYPGYQTYAHSPNICANWIGLGHSCGYGCEYDAECPARWQCTSSGLESVCGSPAGAPGPDWRVAMQICESDSDCSGASKCVTPIVGGYAPQMNAEPFKVCQCDPDAVNACGKGYSCNDGLGSMSRHKADSKYLKVQAHYCTQKGPCGNEGSCEWFGDLAMVGEGEPLQPMLYCANAGGLEGAKAKCQAPYRPGLREADRFLCVASQICMPPQTTNDYNEPFCGLLK